MDYDPRNGGHWSPHGVKNFENQKLNNCLFEAVTYEANKQNIKADPFDLKVYAALHKVEHPEKYTDIKSYYNHLASYGNPALLIQGGARLKLTQEKLIRKLSKKVKMLKSHKLSEQNKIKLKKEIEKIK